MRFAHTLFALLGLSLTAQAEPLTWSLVGVVFSNGTSASGSFVFDADTDTYSSIDITTSGGTYGGITFGFLCSAPCAGAAANAENALFLTQSSSTNLAVTPALGFFNLSSPLTDAGGAIALTGNNTGTVLGLCGGSQCVTAVSTVLATAGTLVSTPEPCTAMLSGIATVLFGVRRILRSSYSG